MLDYSLRARSGYERAGFAEPTIRLHLMPTATIRLPRPLPQQAPILDDEARWKWIAAGRRFGKSLVGLIAAVDGHGKTNPVTNEKQYKGALQGLPIAWVAPDYKQATQIWGDLKFACGDVGRKSETERLIRFPGGGSIQVFSAENATAMRGKGFGGAVVDEAAHMPGEVWSLTLRPALSERQGWALFISTPSGFNWFYDGWLRAESDPISARWQRPTADNPLVPAAEIELARGEMRPAEFRQEYLADFTALGNMRFDPEIIDAHAARCKDRPPLPLSVLPNSLRTIPGIKVWELPVPGRAYVMYTDTSEGIPGLDPACTNIMDPTRQIHVATIHGPFEPGTMAGYSAQAGEAYGMALWGVERNNHGHAVLLAAREVIRYSRIWYTEDRQATATQERAGVRPPERPGFLVTTSSKHVLIDLLDEEMKAFRLTSWDSDFWLECRWMEIKGNGGVGAVEGAHDDRPMAMAGVLRMCRIPGITSQRGQRGAVEGAGLTNPFITSSSVAKGYRW